MKKNITLTLVLALLASLSFAGSKSSGEGNDGDNTKLSLYIPGFLVKAGSWFVNEEKDPEAKTALTKMRSISICVREGNAYDEYYSVKYEKKMNKLNRQNFDPLLTVYDDGEKVSVQLKQNKKGKIRQVVIITDDGESEYVFLRVRCNVSLDDIQKWIGSKEKLNEVVTQHYTI